MRIIMKIPERLFIGHLRDARSISERILLVAGIAELISPGLGYENGYGLTKYDLDNAEDTFSSPLWFKVGEIVLSTRKVAFDYLDDTIVGIIKDGDD